MLKQNFEYTGLNNTYYKKSFYMFFTFSHMTARKFEVTRVAHIILY